MDQGYLAGPDTDDTGPRCCDCANARVREAGLAHCREGYGHPPGESVLLSRLMRPRYPRSFRSARTCPKWERA